MNVSQTLNDVSQDRKPLCPGSFNGSQQSTLWIGNKEDSSIASIAIRDLETAFKLKVRISDLHLVKLKLQITPETVLIQGQPTEAAGVEGYFRPYIFESLIPLPHPIQPESCRTEMQPDGLTIELAKDLKHRISKIQLQLSAET